MSILRINALQVHAVDGEHSVPLLRGVDLEIEAGETVGLAGESGSGKTLTGLSVMGLLPQPAVQLTGGELVFQGQPLTTLPVRARQQLRGASMSMVFQEPMTALNPVQRVGLQLSELYQIHHPELSRALVRQQLLQALSDVGVSDAERRLEAYPHELSGGLRQRMMIAMALALKPALLICDEPTTALDVTIQAQVLDLIRGLTREMGTAVLFITHDLGVLAELADRVAVMYGGVIVEQQPIDALFERPQHPYTEGLMRSIPRFDHAPRLRLDIIPGQVPQANESVLGCRFHPRCARATARCQQESPKMNHGVACHYPGQAVC